MDSGPGDLPPAGPLPGPARLLTSTPWPPARSGEGTPIGSSKSSIVAVTGFFDLVLHDGRRNTTIHLDSPAVGAYIPRYSWRELRNFSPGAVCLVLASLPYEESDYIRDFEDFVHETVDSRPRGPTNALPRTPQADPRVTSGNAYRVSSTMRRAATKESHPYFRA